MKTTLTVQNYINGEWTIPDFTEQYDVYNPATGQELASVPLTSPAEVDRAARVARRAFPEWRRVPVTRRIQYLFHLKNLLEENFEDLAHQITEECGKTLAESRGELRRAVENVEVACGTPILMQGYNSEDIAGGIDEMMIRQPIGVAAIVAPFNFPAMIPFWFLPYALACGNTVIVKPSERVPLSMQRVFHLLAELDLPPGVVNLVNGSRDTVNALLDHEDIDSVSFVGSTAVAKYVYSRATSSGKRAQCSGGAKNPIIVLPDADLEMTTRIVADSAFGCAGQRCLAASLAITVGDESRRFTDAISDVASNRNVGNGLDESVEMGPVITPESRSRIEGLVEEAVIEGATLRVDGRGIYPEGLERGNFMHPTVLDNLDPGGKIARTEIFGPVLGLIHVETIDEAIAFINSGRYGNMACLFTSSGANARRFRYEAESGNIGINIGVAAPMAFFPFGGWKHSFFGDLHGQGRNAVEFFTRQKVVIERWPREWSRKF